MGVSSSLVLSDSAVSICVNSLFKKHRTWMPFDQLDTVVYSRPSLQPKAYGTLLFRGKMNKDVPIPQYKNFHGDKTAITVSLETETLFYHIFYMLKAVAPQTARFKMLVHPTNIKNIDKLVQTVDIDYFYEMYAPHRERAISGIQAKYGVSKETARELVNREFDARQKKVYEADPLDAIRDLNLVVANMRSSEQRANRADAERRKRQEQDAVRASLERLETMKTLEMLEDYSREKDL